MVLITLKEQKKYPVQYEKLPIFCNFCGLMGHEVMECGDGVHKDEEYGWGDWLTVKFSPSSGDWGDGRGRGRVGGRGRGRGRGWGASFKDDVENSLKKKKDDVENMNLDKSEDEEDYGKMQGAVADKVMLIEGGGGIPSPQKVQDKKRMRKSSDERVSDPNLNISAPSVNLEGVREQ